MVSIFIVDPLLKVCEHVWVPHGPGEQSNKTHPACLITSNIDCKMLTLTLEFAIGNYFGVRYLIWNSELMLVLHQTELALINAIEPKKIKNLSLPLPYMRKLFSPVVMIWDRRREAGLAGGCQLIHQNFKKNQNKWKIKHLCKLSQNNMLVGLSPI